MENWQATSMLRWLVTRYKVRDDIDRKYDSWSGETHTRQLQQQWQCIDTGKLEWRDVPEELVWAEEEPS